VALTVGLADKVDPLLAQQPPTDVDVAKADTAIFYSISNCQDGLRGISFGNFLIKQVVEELRAELPRLTRFATLSPVPGFRRWLEAYLPEHPDEIPGDALTDWPSDEAGQDALKLPLLRLCALYLAGSSETKDPVARFHLGNGARLERVNWRANLSSRGIRESFGIMVNYLYDPETIEANHEAFVRQGQVARSAAVAALIHTGPPVKKPSRLTGLVPTRKSRVVPA
jgi:malonyl-CoA decarboxylase